MNAFNAPLLDASQEMAVKMLLAREGRIAAIKLYMKFTNARLWEAKIAVEKLGAEIEPGPASARRAGAF
jgi:ribosomal protein L7/L12